MNLLITLAVIAIIAVGAWDLRDGSLDLPAKLSINKYGSFLTQIKAKNLPFKVLSPSYLPSGFKFLKEDSAKIVQGNIGIPQVNYLFESADGKNGLALKQFDQAIYQKTMAELLKKTGFKDWPTFFAAQYQAKPLERAGQTIYLSVPAEKVRSILGDYQYMASAHLINGDSVIELNYSGDAALAEAELIKMILALQPAK